MKYIILANNQAITNDLINNINIDYNTDIVVTLNHGWPLSNLDIINKYNNIYHFCRRSFNREVPYSGLLFINSIKDKLSKIFLYPHPDAVNKKDKNKVNIFLSTNTSFKNSDISHMAGFSKYDKTQQTRKFLSSIDNKVTNMSMGLITYIYLCSIKNQEDNIYLVGFTHKMNANKHNPQGEKEFFIKEQSLGLCAIYN